MRRRQDVGELVQLLFRKFAERGHDARADFDRAEDRRARDPGADVGQFGTGPVVAVLTQFVAGEAARPGHDLRPGLVLGRDLHVDLGGRTPGRTGVGQVAHREDGEDPGGGRQRWTLRATLGAAVVERQQQEQDHADGRDADRRYGHQLRRFDDPQDLEEEEEVPLGARHVGGRRRVRLRTLGGAEDQRHRDDRAEDDYYHRRVLQHRVGEQRLPFLLQYLVFLEIRLLVGGLHAVAGPSPL